LDGYVVVDLTRACGGIEEALSRNGYVSIGPLFSPNDEYWLWTSGVTPTQIEVWVPAETRP